MLYRIEDIYICPIFERNLKIFVANVSRQHFAQDYFTRKVD